MIWLATFKHISSKNANYSAAEKYLTFEHDEFTMKPTLDENGRLIPREDYRITTLNCGDAANMEIIRRYYRAAEDAMRGKDTEEAVHRHEMILRKAGLTPNFSPCRAAALEKEEATGKPCGAMRVNGITLTGKTSALLGASAALLLNALKALAGIADDINLISPETIEPICKLKTGYLGNKNPRLHSDEALVALAASSVRNPYAAEAMSHLGELRGADAHFSVIISSTDEKTYKKLGINLCCEPKFEHRTMYHR